MSLEVELSLTPLLDDFFPPSDLAALCLRSLPANLFWIRPLSILEAPPPRQPREAQPPPPPLDLQQHSRPLRSKEEASTG